MDKDNLTTEILKQAPFFQVFGIGVLFGLVSWIQKVRSNPIKKNVFDFSSEIVMSIAGGFLASKLCDAISLNENYKVVAICIASYSGVKFIEFINYVIMSKIGKEAGLDSDKVNDEINRLNEEEKKSLMNNQLVKCKDTDNQDTQGQQ